MNCRYLTSLFLVLLLSGCSRQTEKTRSTDPVVSTTQHAAEDTAPFVSFAVKTEKATLIGKPAEPRPEIPLLRFDYGNIGTGTGFFVSYKKRTFLITVKHLIVSGADLLAVVGGRAVPIEIVSSQISIDYDLAAFLLKENNVKTLSLEDATVLESVPKLSLVTGIPPEWKPIPCVAYGYPDSLGFRECLGYLKHRVDALGQPYFISSFGSASGMSGGPWINKNTGRVVGVHYGSVGTSASDSRGAATPITYLIPLLDNLLK